jgi:Zn-dependent protease
METVFNIIVVVMSVVVHEVAHGLMARKLGDKTAEYAGRLTLNPIKHLDPIGSVILPALLVLSGSKFLIGWAKPVPYNPYNLKNQRWGEALVAFVGPLSNFILALFFGLFIRFGLLPVSSISIVIMIILTNLSLFLFNLTPIPPLDGSKILFAVLPQRYYWIREYLEKYGLLIALFFAFFLWQYLTPLIYKMFFLIIGLPPEV